MGLIDISTWLWEPGHKECYAVWRMLGGVLAISLILVAIFLPTSEASFEGMSAGLGEIILGSTGLAIGVFTSLTRFGLTEFDCEYCGGKGYTLDKADSDDLVGRVEDEIKGALRKCKDWLSRKLQKLSGREVSEPKPKFRHIPCPHCNKGQADVSFMTCTKNRKENVHCLGFGSTILIGWAIICLFVDVAPIGSLIVCFFGVCPILSVLKNHLKAHGLVGLGTVTETVTIIWESLYYGSDSTDRRLAAIDCREYNAFLGVVGATIASLVAWYVLFREKAKPLPSHRKTIIHRKKRPTFLKNPKSTLGACRRHTCAVTRH